MAEYSKRSTRGWPDALFALVPVAWILVLNVAPLFAMLQISLLDRYPLPPQANATYTLRNYAEFFRESVYLVPFWKTAVFAIVVTAATLVVCFPIAYFLARVALPKRRLAFFLLLIVPFWAGEVLRLFSLITVLGNRGLINIALIELGVISRPTRFLYNYFSVTTGIIYIGALYMILPLYSALEKIPQNMLDAAADLGAGGLARFGTVVVPLAKDGIVLGLALTFLLNIGSYSVPILLGGPETSLFAETIGTFFLVAGDRWPMGAAFSIILLVSSLAFVGLFARRVAVERSSP